jgi:hypothetical protein
LGYTEVRFGVSSQSDSLLHPTSVESGSAQWGISENHDRIVKGPFVNHLQSLRAPKPESSPGLFGPFSRYFRRLLDDDMIVLGDAWLKESGVQRQLEFEGYQLRWVQTSRLDLNSGDGWEYVTVPHHLWWMRRVRRRHGALHQYLMKKGKSFRSQTGY